MNTLLVGLVCAIVAIVLYMINAKIENKETNNSHIVKMGILGACLGISSIFLGEFAAETPIRLDQDIMTGTPNF